MRRRVGGGAERAFDDVAIEIDDDHVLGPHRVVGDAAGLDDREFGCTIKPADIAPGERD